MNKLFGALFICSFLVSCGNNGFVWPMKQVQAQSVEPATSEEFTYSFSGRKCTTGTQSAKTFEEICQKLANDELNDGCAEDKREDLFYTAECPGSFI